MNILFILDDALRARNLGCYGYPKPTSPNCDRLAAEGVRFETCIAVSAHTFPPIVSLLTGLTPFSHGMMAPRDYTRWLHQGAWRDRRLPLHVLADAGWLVDGELVRRWAPLGFTRDWNDLESYLDAQRDRRWFYLAEPYPTHLPYNPPQAYYEQFLDPDFRPDEAMRRRLDIVRSRMILHPPDVTAAMEVTREDAIGEGDAAHKRSSAIVEFEPQDAPGVRALYDGEVRVFADQVGGWLAKLEALGILDETLVIVTADHGEELLERGHVGHTSCNLKGTLYDESVHVPLILRYPKRLPAGRVVRQQVSQIDLMPTLFELLGLELPLPSDGSSLLPLIEGRAQSFRPEAFAETPPAGWQALSGDERRLRCLRTAEWKLIVHHDPTAGTERSELYHLTEDPGERRSLADREVTVAARLRAALDAQLRRRANDPG
jgi:arylsulfatase A-like enzyme